MNPGLTQQTCEIPENGGYKAQAAEKKDDFEVGILKYYDF